MQKRKGLSAYGLFELGKYKFNLANGLLLGFAFAALSNMITVWQQWNEFSLTHRLRERCRKNYSLFQNKNSSNKYKQEFLQQIQKNNDGKRRWQWKRDNIKQDREEENK